MLKHNQVQFALLGPSPYIALCGKDIKDEGKGLIQALIDSGLLLVDDLLNQDEKQQIAGGMELVRQLQVAAQLGEAQLGEQEDDQVCNIP